VSTVRGAISGRHLLVEIAAALDMPEADMLSSANLEYPTTEVHR
jgi:hypothetical protein